MKHPYYAQPRLHPGFSLTSFCSTLASPRPAETFLGTLPGDNKPCSTPVSTVTSTALHVICEGPVCFEPTSVCSAGEPTGPTPSPPVTETVVSSGACTATVEVMTRPHLPALPPPLPSYPDAAALSVSACLFLRAQTTNLSSTLPTPPDLQQPGLQQLPHVHQRRRRYPGAPDIDAWTRTMLAHHNGVYDGRAAADGNLWVSICSHYLSIGGQADTKAAAYHDAA